MENLWIDRYRFKNQPFAHQKKYLPMQPGDVKQTYADVQELINDYQFAPSTNIES